MQQQYYKDTYVCLDEYFVQPDKLAALTTALQSDTTTDKAKAEKTTALIKKALYFGSADSYTKNQTSTTIATSLNEFAKEHLVTLEDKFDNSKLTPIVYTDQTLSTLEGNLNKVDGKVNLYAYFPVIQGIPYTLNAKIETLQSKDNTLIGSLNYTKALQVTLSKEINHRTPPKGPYDDTNIWPVYTKIVLKENNGTPQTFEQFSSALDALKSKLKDTTETNYGKFITEVDNFKTTYNTYKSSTAFYDELIKSLNEKEVVETTFEANDATYTYAQLITDIKGIVNEYFEKETVEGASESFADFKQKIENLALIVHYDNMNKRTYSTKKPKITIEEFQATIPSIKTSYLKQLKAVLDRIIASQKRVVEILKTDLKAAQQRNEETEGNLNGKIIINVDEFKDAESIVKALLANEYIKENIYAIKLKYQEEAVGSTIEHEKVVLIYEQGIFTQLGFDPDNDRKADYIDSVGNNLKSEVTSILAKKGIEGAKDYFPFWHQLGATDDYNSGVFWCDENPISNHDDFAAKRCKAIADTLIYFYSNELQKVVLHEVYKDKIITMFQVEGRKVSDVFFQRNDIDPILPYLRYQVL